MRFGLCVFFVALRHLFFGFAFESTTAGFIAVKFKYILVWLKLQLVNVVFFGCTEHQTLAFLRPVKTAFLMRVVGFGANEATALLSGFVVHGYTGFEVFAA